MTSEQAQAYLAEMGVSATVTENTEEVEDQKDAVGWHAEQTGSTPVETDVTAPPTPNSDGTFTEGATSKIISHIGTYRMVPDPVEETAMAAMTNFAMEVDTAGGKSGGGHLTIDRSTARKTGGGGSQKRSGSAAPHSSGGGGCFVAGTLVSLQNQFKNIEDIQIGDIVLSYNEEIHQNEYSIVLQTMIHDVTEEIYDLYIEDEILTVTGIHRFYIRRKHDIE